MRNTTYFLLFTLFLVTQSQAQLQTADGEGVSQAAYLKKLSKKAKYGAYQISKEINFSPAKGITGTPVVSAEETGSVEMVSIENKAMVGYVIPYNNFVKLKDYDFDVYYKNNFKSQKYPPEKVSMTDESIFFDDNYGLLYGFEAQESGQRARFRYNYVYTDAKYLTRLFFHEGIPIRQSKITFKVPAWLDIEITEKNFGNYKIKKEVHKDKNLNVYTYTAENLVGIKQESSSLARPFYLPHLVITVRSFTVDQKKINGFKTVDDLYAWYDFLYKKADNKPEVLKDQVALLTKGKSTDEEKIKAIYYWVQDNVRYIAFEEGYSGFVPQSVQEVFKNKYGDCKGMANLLTEMLKSLGYDAHFAWIGTREIPYDFTEIQSMCVDNHAICVLYFNGKTYFLDGTEKFAPFGRNAYRIQGKKVLVEKGDHFSVEQVPVPDIQENSINTKATLALKGNKIIGHVSMKFGGEANLFFHYIYNNIPVNKRKDFINRLIQLNGNNSEVSNIVASDFKNRDIPISLEGDIEINNQVTLVDSLCYTSIDFFPSSITNFIPDEERQSPIDLDEVFISNDEVYLDLPAKSKVKFLPPNFSSNFNKNSMDASYKIEGNKIILKKKMVINSPVIFTEEFGDWKSFLNKIKDFNHKNLTIRI